MKKLIVSEIPIEGLEYDLSDWIKSKEIEFTGPIKGFLKVIKSDDEVIIQGAFKTSINLQCSRCAESFDFAINTLVNTTFHPAKTLTRDDNYELHDEELDTEFYSNDTIDMLDFITQEVMLNIPMKPLCKDTCKGICPNCGADLNKNTCQCHKSLNKGVFADLDKIISRKER
ncbi:MAG: DUF177 domain-containing protein [Thermodesulfovibrionales bacterium]|nr:DUF177 domain-containing protein [Thermodesulfovibrionales bacterium]